MKKIIILGVICLFVGMGFTGSTYSLSMSKSSDEVEPELKMVEIDSHLSVYGLNTRNTICEFEQILYYFASKSKWRNPSLATELKNDIDELCDILEQIGVTDDMTLAEAITIIENNKEQLQAGGINLFCSINIYLEIKGWCSPIWREYRALFGVWGVGFDHWGNHITIEGFTGLQHCEGYGCSEDFKGRFIGLEGTNPPVIYFGFPFTNQIAWVRGDFVIFSRSNVPFVESKSGSQQSQCPCNSQGCGIE